MKDYRSRFCPTQFSGFLSLALGLAALCLLPSLAQAHPGHAEPGGLHHGGAAFWSGLFHPLGGLDHLLAMVAVGVWAAQLGGRALWTVPGAFLIAMLLGGWMGLSFGAFVWVEPGIAVSVLILGLLIAFTVRLPWAIPAALVAVFALCHGAAHGVELPAGLSAAGYTGGFLLATAMLHAAGLAGGMLLVRSAPAPILRWAGVGVAVAGVFLLGQVWMG